MGNQCCDSRNQPPQKDTGEVIVDPIKSAGQANSRKFQDSAFHKLEPSLLDGKQTADVFPAKGMQKAFSKQRASDAVQKSNTDGSSLSGVRMPLTPREENLHFADGSTYIGEWLNGQPHGKGKWTNSDGSYYDGHWNEGKKCGWGVFVNSDCRVTGNWEDGEIEGEAEEEYANGISYRGEFQHGQRNGFGRLSFPNGQFYEGNFQKDHFEGQGLYHWLNEEYNGQWHRSKMHGQGKYIWEDGRHFTGHYQNGAREGYGELFEDGLLIRANWRNGKPFGRIVEINQEGVVRQFQLSL